MHACTCATLTCLACAWHVCAQVPLRGARARLDHRPRRLRLVDLARALGPLRLRGAPTRPGALRARPEAHTTPAAPERARRRAPCARSALRVRRVPPSSVRAAPPCPAEPVARCAPCLQVGVVYDSEEAMSAARSLGALGSLLMVFKAASVSRGHKKLSSPSSLTPCHHPLVSPFLSSLAGLARPREALLPRDDARRGAPRHAGFQPPFALTPSCHPSHSPPSCHPLQVLYDMSAFLVVCGFIVLAHASAFFFRHVDAEVRAPAPPRRPHAAAEVPPCACGGAPCAPTERAAARRARVSRGALIAVSPVRRAGLLERGHLALQHVLDDARTCTPRVYARVHLSRA